MTDTITFISLDKYLHVGRGPLSFSEKKIIFNEFDRWYYHFTGLITTPAQDAVYGTYVGSIWAISKSVSKLIRWDGSLGWCDND